MLAARIDQLLNSSSWIRKMFEEGIRLKQERGESAVSDFSLGNPHLPPPAAVLDCLEEMGKDRTPGLHRYMPNAGFAGVRSQVAEYVTRQEGMTVPASHILMTSGAACGLSVALRALGDVDDNVVTPTPFFTEYRFYCLHAQLHLRPAQTTADFELDLEQLAGQIDQRTRIVILNSPNNPTGRVYSEASIAGLIDLLTERSNQYGRPIVLLSDEPYRRLVYDDVTIPPLFSRYAATIIAASFSKDLGLAGERIGYLAVHPQFPSADRVMEGLTFCLRTLGFVSAGGLFQRLVGACLDASVDINAYRANRDALCDGLEKLGYELVRPEGAFFLFPRSPIPDDTAFVQSLAQEGVLAVPGVGFGRTGHIRLSYAVEPEVIERSMAGFAAAIKPYR